MPVTPNIIQTAKQTVKASVLTINTIMRLALDMIAPDKAAHKRTQPTIGPKMPSDDPRSINSMGSHRDRDSLQKLTRVYLRSK